MDSINKNKVTINDVAKMSGVSKTTVSRYINGRSDMMSKDVANRIQEVIEKLDFRPSRVAQNLKLKQTGVIGCVISDISSNFAGILIEGISDICTNNDYQVLFVNTSNKLEREIEGIKSLLDSKVDGLIVNTTGRNEEFLLEIRNSGMPIVIADRYLASKEKIDTISSTNYKSTYEIIEYLYKQGYKHVYFFGQSLGNNVIRVIRHQAFLDAKSTLFNNQSSSYTYFITNNHSDDQLVSALLEIRKNHANEDVAIFAVNGMMLLDLVEVFKKLDIKIGTDLGLCGFDDWKWAELVEPGITTIRQDTYQIGARSARRLLQLIQSKSKLKPQVVELPTKLIERGSTLIPPKKEDVL